MFIISLGDRREFILDIKATSQKYYKSCIYFKSVDYYSSSNSEFYIIKVSKSDYEINYW